MPVPTQWQASWQIVKAHQGSNVRRFIQAWIFFDRPGAVVQLVDMDPSRPLNQEHEYELSYTPPSPLPQTDGAWRPACVFIQIPEEYSASTVKVNGVTLDISGSQPDDVVIDLSA